jgi:hypothetical protein
MTDSQEIVYDERKDELDEGAINPYCPQLQE